MLAGGTASGCGRPCDGATPARIVFCTITSYREFYGYYFGATDRVVRRGIADSCGLRRAPDEMDRPPQTAYNVLNAVGSAILAYIAFHPFQIGFVVLEVAWTLISVYALTKALK